MKKIFYLLLIFIFTFLNINSFSNVNADYVQTSNPQHSQSLAADDILKSDHQNMVIVDIANIIVDIWNLKNYIDANLGSIWTEKATQIEYNDKDVYFWKNLRVVDKIKVGWNLIIAEDWFKDNTITTNEIINWQIKKEDLDPSIFASLDTLWKLNWNKWYYNSWNVWIGDSNPSEKLVVNWNIKINTMGKGIIFPDGTIQTTWAIDESNNLKTTGDQVVHGVKTFKKPIKLRNGEVFDTLNWDYYLGDNGEYCAQEGEVCNISWKKRIIYGWKWQYVEKIVTWNTACNNSVFWDPAPWVRKSCYIADIWEHSVSTKAAIKFYIDNELKWSKSVSCNKDNNGRKLKTEVSVSTHDIIKTVKKENSITNFTWNQETTDWQNKSPSYYSWGISVDRNSWNDERGRKKTRNLFAKHTWSGWDYFNRFFADFEWPVETSDCRWSWFYVNLYQDNDNFVDLGVRNSRQRSRSYNCWGSCNNKNFGSGTSNWSCVSGNNCWRWSRLYLRVEQWNKRWNYIYMLNNLSQNKYKYYNNVDFKNKKWTIKVTDLNWVEKYNQTVDLPNPWNGLDITKVKWNYYLRVQAWKSCSSYNPIYIKTYRIGEEITTTEKVTVPEFKYPVNLSPIGNNLCIDWNAINKYKCVDEWGQEVSCNNGDIKNVKQLSAKWNCDDWVSQVNCWVNFEYYCKPDIRTKTVQETKEAIRDKWKVINDKQLNWNRSSNRYTYTNEYTVWSWTYKVNIKFNFSSYRWRGTWVYIYVNWNQKRYSWNKWRSGAENVDQNIDVNPWDKIKIRIRHYWRSRRRSKITNFNLKEYYRYNVNKTVSYDAHYCDQYEEKNSSKKSVVNNGWVYQYSDWTYANSCLEYKNNGATASWNYKIQPWSSVITAYCDMTTDGGWYTFYAVNSWIRTYRSTDNNTCKTLWMDIMVPRTKNHLKAALDKYGRDYFSVVPWISKPSNGWNYTNVAMNSNSAPDRKAVDWWRWWLRDSRYSEPNGDYDANCWLSMYNWDINNIKFNDWHCSYSTTKYICSTNDK